MSNKNIVQWQVQIFGSIERPSLPELEEGEPCHPFSRKESKKMFHYKSGENQDTDIGLKKD